MQKSNWQLTITSPVLSFSAPVSAIDPRDALARGLTSTFANGQMVGEAFAIPVDTLHEAPCNFDPRFTTKVRDLTVEVSRIDSVH